MLRLIAYPPSFGEPSASPFCVKAMCLMQMSGLEWQPEWTPDPRNAPKKKLPVLVDDGETVADSHFIRLHLEKKHGIDFDAGLEAEARARSLAAIRMLEEHFYWAVVHDRWFDARNWEELKTAYFGQIPSIVRGFICSRIRKQARAQIDGHGLGRHSPEEIAQLAIEDLNALAAMLDGKPFLFGDAPTAADAVAGSFIGSALASPHETETMRALKGMNDLVSYANRVREAVYPKGL